MFQRRSLKHHDKARAERQAHELLVRLQNPDNSEPVDRTVPLRKLMHLYKTEILPDQSPSVQAMNRAHIEAWLAFLGPTFDMRRFGRRQWNGFRRARASGAIDCHGRRVEESDRKPVGPRVVAAGLGLIRYAIRVGLDPDDGEPLLERDPTLRLKLPRNRNPKRPVYTEGEYRRLLEVADQVHPFLRPLLIIANGSGRRLAPFRSLRWSDWRPNEGTHGSLQWREETDKLDQDWKTPVSAEMRAAIESMRRTRPGVGDAFMFPEPNQPDRAISKITAYRWLMRCECLAEVEHKPRRAWHGYRRKYASETKHLPAKDAAFYAGWEDPKTMINLYQKVDREGLEAIVANRRELWEAVR